MNENKFEQLVRDYPELFQKAGDIEFAISDGWYNIINTLFRLLTYKLDNAKRLLQFAQNTPGRQTVRSIEELEEDVRLELEKLPVIVQVKEKFGTLRFYADTCTPEAEHYIEFAEMMSGSTCEVCGSPGTARSSGWIKVLCDKHHAEDNPF